MLVVDGEVVTRSFRHYRVPQMADVPATEVLFADTYDVLGPRGAKSMSESPYNPVAPALANAVRDALGVRPHELPMSRDRLWRLATTVSATRPRGAAMSDDTPWISRAVELAVANVAEGGGPFGAVIVRDGELLATGQNRVTRDNDPTAHAEVEAIRAACAGDRRLLPGRLRALRLLRALPALRLGRAVGARRPGRVRRRPRRRRPRRLRRPRVLRAASRATGATWPTPVLAVSARRVLRAVRRPGSARRTARSTDPGRSPGQGLGRPRQVVHTAGQLARAGRSPGRGGSRRARSRRA